VPDYPTTLLEFEARFATEEGCRASLASLRWPEGFACPACGHPQASALLLDHGADPDLWCPVYGRTPLEEAIEQRHLDVAAVLLAHGAR